MIPHGVEIFVGLDPIDLRWSFDRLAGMAMERIGREARSGALFVFGNRTRTAIKVLVYDGQGFWLCQKRLSSGRFAWWPDGVEPARSLQACELQVLLMAGDPSRARAAPAWRALGMVA